MLAGVRRTTDGEELKREAGDSYLVPVYLDVTEASSIKDVLRIIQEKYPDEGLFGLINNAGVAIGGPVECISQEQLSEQLSVNLFGTISITQALLPHIRRANGRIVNIGSVAGRAALPFLGPYAVSKFGIRAISDCLRMELKSSGIRVSLIEPGSIGTPIWEKSGARFDSAVSKMPEVTREIYRDSLNATLAFSKKLSSFGASPKRVVNAVTHALSARHPKAKYLIGLDARALVTLRKFTPTRLGDGILLRIITGVNGEK